MKIIFIGDIVGRSGRDALAKYIPLIKNDFEPDAIIVNSENAAAGYGLTKKIAEEIFSLGVDVITLGNHAWDQREMLSYIEEKNNIIRPFHLAFPVKNLDETEKWYTAIIGCTIGRKSNKLDEKLFI